MCSNLQVCSFDNNLCGYQQSRSDNFDWGRFNLKFTSADTGPSADHTLGTSKLELSLTSVILLRLE